MRKTIAALAVTAGLAGGALIGAPLLSAAAPGEPNPTPPAAGAPAAEHGWAKKALADLVAKGTITQAQADAVLGALKDARPQHPKHPKMRQMVKRRSVAVAAEALGMKPDELHAEIKAGKTIAKVAQEKGVDLQKVIDVIVTEAKADIAKAVTDGKLTQAQADKILANLPARVTAFVNGQHKVDATP